MYSKTLSALIVFAAILINTACIAALAETSPENGAVVAHNELTQVSEAQARDIIRQSLMMTKSREDTKGWIDAQIQILLQSKTALALAEQHGANESEAVDQAIRLLEIRKIADQATPLWLTRQSPVLSEKDYQAHFEDYKEYLETIQPYAFHYFFFKDKAEDPESAQKLAEQTKERIEAGEDVVDLKLALSEAESVTTEPTTLRRNNPQAAPDLIEVLDALGRGEVSEPIELKTGYALVYKLPEQPIDDYQDYESFKTNPLRAEKFLSFVRETVLTPEWHAQQMVELHKAYPVELTGIEDPAEPELPAADATLFEVGGVSMTFGQYQQALSILEGDKLNEQNLASMLDQLRGTLSLYRYGVEQEDLAIEKDSPQWQILRNEAHQRYLIDQLKADSAQTEESEGWTQKEEADLVKQAVAPYMQEAVVDQEELAQFVDEVADQLDIP